MEQGQNKEQLMKMAEKRVAHRGAPHFGITEGELLKMKQSLANLVKSNNILVEAMQPVTTNKIVDRALEAHMMMQVILGILVEKGLTSSDDLNQLAQRFQMESGGLTDKAAGEAAAVGDVILIKFKLFDGDKLVDDQTSSLMTYHVGSKDLPCDEGLVGIHVGESRTFDVVFGEGFRMKELIGKTLQIHIWCHAVKVKGMAPVVEAPKAEEKQA